MRYVAQLLKSKQTVFTYETLASILHIEKKETIKSLCKRLVQSGILVHIYAGIWTLVEYDHNEFASKLRSPSYISLETVLQKAGIIFQDYSNTTTMVWTNSLSKTIDNHLYQYRKLQQSILLDPLGVIYTGRYMIATPERAVADMLYFYHHYYFDHPYDIDIDKLNMIKYIYPPTTILAIDKLIEHVKRTKT